jgi:hypothetical protein
MTACRATGHPASISPTLAGDTATPIERSVRLQKVNRAHAHR